MDLLNAKLTNQNDEMSVLKIELVLLKADTKSRSLEVSVLKAELDIVKHQQDRQQAATSIDNEALVCFIHAETGKPVCRNHLLVWRKGETCHGYEFFELPFKRSGPFELYVTVHHTNDNNEEDTF